jgi:hypothetical protein
MKNPNKVKQGKKNKAAGRAFELKVRKDLEAKGLIMAKWTNNVEFNPSGKLVPAKHKFNFFTKVMALGTGFPDFIGYQMVAPNFKGEIVMSNRIKKFEIPIYNVLGVEAKSNGYLDKAEKEKCKWLIDNHIFANILIASKGLKRGTIEYKYFKNEQ